MTCRHDAGKSAGPLCPDCAPARLYAEAVRACAVAGITLSHPGASLDCDHCGDVAITSAVGMFWDGDGGHCQTCGYPGRVSCDSETAPEWVCEDEGECAVGCEDCDAAADVLTAALWPREGT